MWSKKMGWRRRVRRAKVEWILYRKINNESLLKTDERVFFCFVDCYLFIYNWTELVNAFFLFVLLKNSIIVLLLFWFICRWFHSSNFSICLQNLMLNTQHNLMMTVFLFIRLSSVKSKHELYILLLFLLVAMMTVAMCILYFLLYIWCGCGDTI